VNADAIANGCNAPGQPPIKTMHHFRENVDKNKNHDSWSYGPSFPQMFAKAAKYVDKILNAPGDKATFAGNLPVFEPAIIESESEQLSARMETR
jgi:hypothetical protein